MKKIICGVEYDTEKSTVVKKYTEELVYDCDDLLEECDDCDIAIEDAEEEECCCCADAE